MKRLLRKIRSRRGVTLVEMVAAAAVLALLALMLHTGLYMAQNSYTKMTEAAESQLLLSTLTDLLSNELRYARDVVTDDGTLQRYTSLSFGRNTTLALNAQGQLEANQRLMLSAGAYGNGQYRITDWEIAYSGGVFNVSLSVTGNGDAANTTTFSVRCLNADSDEGEST